MPPRLLGTPSSRCPCTSFLMSQPQPDEKTQNRRGQRNLKSSNFGSSKKQLLPNHEPRPVSLDFFLWLGERAQIPLLAAQSRHILGGGRNKLEELDASRPKSLLSARNSIPRSKILYLLVRFLIKKGVFRIYLERFVSSPIFALATKDKTEKTTV